MPVLGRMEVEEARTLSLEVLPFHLRMLSLQSHCAELCHIATAQWIEPQKVYFSFSASLTKEYTAAGGSR